MPGEGAKGKGTIVGYVGLDLNSDQGVKGAIELRRMGVSIHHRRRGIGAQLLRAVIASTRRSSPSSN
ncbi:hypothetical protein DFP72DRAFT_889078 [Ephemerocybe angulata]|uniref:N-acetyltransferase domain-containing protein n=1 Tax=Ephemerocybe angulata TaxID=980116 RepID=A0A8H6I4A5_9AGAR|nr:hypothetical protein DFP72DRAFT_889078 [Tulosesus angulatus]